jgi:hypothetical protein
MKRKVLIIPAIAIGLSVFPGLAFAQATPPPALPHRDLVGVVAWQNVRKSGGVLGYFDDWYNRAGYGGGAFGWYWTDHHKTEIEGGASIAARFLTYETYQAGNVTGYVTSEYRFSTRRLAISEHYQFGRNAWFHPHVAAGVDLNWETTTGNAGPVFASSPSREIRPAQTIAPETRFHARPFGEGGFKAYMTPRAFFRTDLRLFVHNGIDEAQLRFGLGFDF